MVFVFPGETLSDSRIVSRAALAGVWSRGGQLGCEGECVVEVCRVPRIRSNTVKLKKGTHPGKSIRVAGLSVAEGFCGPLMSDWQNFRMGPSRQNSGLGLRPARTVNGFNVSESRLAPSSSRCPDAAKHRSCDTPMLNGRHRDTMDPYGFFRSPIG